MKIITVVLLAGMSTAAAAQGTAGHSHGASHAHAAHSAVPAAAPAKGAPLHGADAVVKVNGLVCDFCVQALTKTFRKRAEVRGFQVNLDAKELRVAFAPGRSLDDATIRKLVTDAGYNVVGISRKAA